MSFICQRASQSESMHGGYQVYDNVTQLIMKMKWARLLHFYCFISLRNITHLEYSFTSIIKT